MVRSVEAHEVVLIGTHPRGCEYTTRSSFMRSSLAQPSFRGIAVVDQRACKRERWVERGEASEGATCGQSALQTIHTQVGVIWSHLEALHEHAMYAHG
jgi:hypothetical protein